MKNSLKILLAVLTFVSLSFIDLEPRTINVVIDAGHGGSDHGAKNSTFSEKELVAAITKKITDLNTDTAIKIHLTRNADDNISLLDRADLINSFQPDLAISLHVNQNQNSATKGYEVYVSDKSASFEKSKELAEKLSEKFSQKSPLQNRGVKSAPFMVLKKSNCPTLLMELGFISNEHDRNYLVSDAGQNEIAQTILDFLSDLKE